MAILVREFSVLYEAFRQGRPSPLPPLEIQYADFAVWQRDWLQGEQLEEQLAFWRCQLTGAPAVLHLPADRARPILPSFRGAQADVMLSPALKRDLLALSRREGVTLFMTLLAGFKTLLYRYSSQEEVVVGTNVANRERIEIEGLIGFFVNNLVLRTSFAGNPTFRELLGRVREVCLGAYDHQDLPFEKLVEQLNPERHLSHNPLFQALFVLQNNTVPDFTVPDLALRPIEIEFETSGFDLLFNMWETVEALAGSLRYNTDLFDHSTINQLLDQFAALLEQVVENPDQRVNNVSLRKHSDPLASAFNEDPAADLAAANPGV